MRRRLPITVLLAGAVTLPAFLLAGLLFVIALGVAERNTAELTRDKVQLLLDIMAARIEAHLAPIELQASALEEGLRSSLSLEEGEARDRRIFEILRGATAAAPQLSGIAWVQADGSIHRILLDPFRQEALKILPDALELRAFVDDAKDRTEGYWADFVLPEEGAAPLLNFRLPIHADGKLAGVLGLGISIDQLSGFLEQLQGEGGAADFGTAFILQGEDLVVAHPLLQWDFPTLSAEQPLPRLESFPDPVLAHLFRGETRSPPERYLGNFEARLYQLAGVSYVGFYRTLEGFTEIPFTFGTVTPASAVDDQVARIEKLPIVGGVLLAVTLLGGVLLGRRLAQPMKRLREGAQRISALELDEHPGFGRSLFRELDDAQRAFDGMLGGLRLFALYVPRSLVRRLILSGQSEGPKSEERWLTVMFTDIAGFTALSETKSAQEVSRLLGACVEREGGTIDKFIGDALMAFWGAPEPLGDPEVRACRAALAMAEALTADNTRRRGEGLEPIRVRIGLHAGLVVVGNIGSPDRVNYTIIGDPVNIGQRLEAAAKTLLPGLQDDCVILISDELRRRLGEGWLCDDLGEVPLSGRSQKVRVYRLRAAPEA